MLSKNARPIEIAVCGNSFAGKTALVAALRGAIYPLKHPRINFNANGGKIILSDKKHYQIWDVSGESKYRHQMLRPLYILRSSLCLLVIEPKNANKNLKNEEELLKELEEWMQVFQTSASTQRERENNVPKRLMVVISKADTLDEKEKKQFLENYKAALKRKDEKEKAEMDVSLDEDLKDKTPEQQEEFRKLLESFKQQKTKLDCDLTCNVAFCSASTKAGIRQLRAEILRNINLCAKEPPEPVVSKIQKQLDAYPVVSVIQEQLDTYAKAHKFNDICYTNKLRNKENYYFDRVILEDNCFSIFWQDAAAKKSQNAKYSAYFALKEFLVCFEKRVIFNKKPEMTLEEAKDFARKYPAVLDGKLGEIFKSLCPANFDSKKLMWTAASKKK